MELESTERDDVSSRRYHSEIRAESARETRHRILDAARGQLLERGYHGTSIAALADAAGVSPQTIYNAVGGKAQVLKAVYDVLLAGDEEPVAMKDRPEFLAVLAARTLPAAMRAYAHLGRRIAARIGDLLGMVLAEGAGPDAELRAFLDTIDGERRTGATLVARHLATRFGLPETLTEQRAADHIWTVTAPEAYHRLARRRGWTLDEYEGWLANVLTAGLRT